MMNSKTFFNKKTILSLCIIIATAILIVSIVFASETIKNYNLSIKNYNSNLLTSNSEIETNMWNDMLNTVTTYRNSFVLLLVAAIIFYLLSVTLIVVRLIKPKKATKIIDKID